MVPSSGNVGAAEDVDQTFPNISNPTPFQDTSVKDPLKTPAHHEIKYKGDNTVKGFVTETASTDLLELS
jgi:hypothetical protein